MPRKPKERRKHAVPQKPKEPRKHAAPQKPEKLPRKRSAPKHVAMLPNSRRRSAVTLMCAKSIIGRSAVRSTVCSAI